MDQNANKYSWQLLEEGFNPLQGPVSKEYGFMNDPIAMKSAQVILPPSWIELWQNLPKHFIEKEVRDICIHKLEDLDVYDIYKKCENDPLSFMKTKSVVFCIAQGCIDFDRVIAKEMPEPLPLPDKIQKAMDDFAEICKCPDYCALADMSLTASILVNEDIDVRNCTFDDFLLICPVNNSPSKEEVANGDTASAKIRGNAENRFHNTPTMIEYRVSDLVGIVAQIQKTIALCESLSDDSVQYENCIEHILDLIAQAKESFARLRVGFALLSKRTVDPVVWHRDIVKYTSGYGGHLGLSGPQTPCVHLIDAFLGRKSFKTELGKTSMKAFLQTQHNHQVFIKSVAEGPQLRDFAEKCNQQQHDHPLALAYNDLVKSYTQGFLAVHKGRAMEFAQKGFGEAGPREFTAETDYVWPATEKVVKKLQRFFDEATQERGSLKIK